VDPGEYRKTFELERTGWWFAAKRRVVGMLLAQAGVLPGRAGTLRALDGGCGTGGTLEWLADYGWAVGLDLSPAALGYCVQRGQDRLACGVLDHLPFADASFDLVTLFDVLYHEWVADDEATMREVGRVMRPGGLVVITDAAMPFLRGPHDRVYCGARRYTRASLRRAVEGAGFRVRRISYFHFLIFPVVAAVRLAQKCFSARRARSDLQLVPGFLNATLRSLYWIECALLRRLSLPWGSSIVCVAEYMGARVPTAAQRTSRRAPNEAEGAAGQVPMTAATGQEC
jgi:SAM-dependent methyltransferase